MRSFLALSLLMGLVCFPQMRRRFIIPSRGPNHRLCSAKIFAVIRFGPTPRRAPMSITTTRRATTIPPSLVAARRSRRRTHQSSLRISEPF